MTLEEWVNRLRREGFTDEHIQKLCTTNKSMSVETGWRYSPFGLNAKVTPTMGVSVLTNYYINGKNHWRYMSRIDKGIYFTGEHLEEFKLSTYDIIDTANHPDYIDYRKKFLPNINNIYVRLEDVDKEYLKIGRFAAKREGQSVVLFKFNISGIVENHIHIGSEEIHEFKDWFQKVMLKK